MSKGKLKTRYNIQVTEQDIEKARKDGVGDSFNCVVSRTIARVIPDATYIDTDTQTVRFSREGHRFKYLTPYAVQGYVIAFDAGEPLEPFSFQLRDPAKVRKTKKTPAGNAANTAAIRARRKAERKINNGEEADPREEAKAAYTAVRKAKPGKTSETAGDGPKAPPRVWKKKTRKYGQRLLRINQEA